MQLLLKYWKAKVASALLALVATLGGWVTFAWPEPSATASPTVDEAEVAGALQYLAAVDAARQAAAAPPPEVHQVVVVTRPVPPEEIVVVVGADGQAPVDIPPQALAAAAPVAPAQPRPQPVAPRQPSPPPAQAPAPSAPPAPAPEPKKPPAPAPTVSKGS